MKKIIETQRAPGAIGPYVQGVDLGSMVFTPVKFRFAHRPVRSRLMCKIRRV
ncbi:TdcF protein [Escherichia coli]|nr:TdcF protein [Escherichia coli]